MTTNGNGKPRRSRAPSREPTNGEATRTPHGPEDASAGLTEPQTGTVKTDGPYGGVARNEHGHFGPGNKAASGNGNARRMQEYRRQFLEAINPGTMPALARKLQVDALKGDEFSVRVLCDYCLGKPTAAVELSGPNGEPLGINFHAVTAIVLSALSGPEHAEARVKIAAQLIKLDEARDADAHV